MQLSRFLTGIPRSTYIFMGFVALFCGLFVFVELNNHKLWTNDYRVYYDAVHQYFGGGKPYGQAFGLDTGFFKYPPFALFLFYPVEHMSYGMGQIVHLSLLAISLLVSVPVMKALVQRVFEYAGPRRQAWILYLAFFSVAIHLVRELHMGNINLLLLLLLSLGLRAIHAKNLWGTALCWSLMLIFKPIMILVVIPLLLLKQWRLVFLMGGFGIFFFLFPALHAGWSGNMKLWADWLQSISAHGDYLESYNSLNYLMRYYAGFPKSWLGPLLFLVILTVFMYFDLRKNPRSERQALVWTVAFAAFIPNFFLTDTEHFLLTIPLLVVLLHLLSQTTKKMLWIGFILGFLLFSINSTDLFGKELSEAFAVRGFLGIGNLIFIVTLLLVWRSNRRELSA